MELTVKDYQRLKAKYKKLKYDYKYIRRYLEREVHENMNLENEIFNINTNTMNQIIQNNLQFNKN